MPNGQWQKCSIQTIALRQQLTPRNDASGVPDSHPSPAAPYVVYLKTVVRVQYQPCDLQADQLVVQGMMASRYLAQFEEVVSGWQTQLSMVRYDIRVFRQTSTCRLYLLRSLRTQRSHGAVAFCDSTSIAKHSREICNLCVCSVGFETLLPPTVGRDLCWPRCLCPQ